LGDEVKQGDEAMSKIFDRQEQRVTIKSFEDPGAPGTGIDVTGYAGKPLTWSLNFYSSLPDNRVGHFLRPGVRVVNALAVADMAGMRLARLIDEAILFVKDSAQDDADAYIERKQEKETRDQERKQHKDVKLSPLSQNMTEEAKMFKKLRHENNLQARRSSDQELRSRMRGK
jgi:hypothetical protein